MLLNVLLENIDINMISISEIEIDLNELNSMDLSKLSDRSWYVIVKLCNRNMTLDNIKFIRSHDGEINWDSISYHIYYNFSIEFVKEFSDKLNFDNILDSIKHQLRCCLCLDKKYLFKFINEFKDYLNWKSVEKQLINYYYYPNYTDLIIEICEEFSDKLDKNKISNLNKNFHGYKYFGGLAILDFKDYLEQYED